MGSRPSVSNATGVQIRSTKGPKNLRENIQLLHSKARVTMHRLKRHQQRWRDLSRQHQNA